MNTKQANGRGGARPNSGPKPKVEDGRLVTQVYRLPQWQIDTISKVAAEQGRYPAEVVRDILGRSLKRRGCDQGQNSKPR